jgi:hypothetical protein
MGDGGGLSTLGKLVLAVIGLFIVGTIIYFVLKALISVVGSIF